MADEDPRETAARWLLDTTPDGALVALADDPFFYTPPIDPTAGCVKRAALYGGPPVWDLVERHIAAAKTVRVTPNTSVKVSGG